MKYSTILFDFDGTLADTAPLALAAANALAEEFGFAPVRDDELSALRTLPARRLIARAKIPIWNVWKLRRFEARMRQEIRARAAEVKLFPGIPELLHNLRAAGYRLGIVTSNDEALVTGILSRAGTRVDFLHAGSRFFGKAAAIANTLRKHELKRQSVLYVCDELRDIEACKKAGVDFLAIAWGFNTPEALRSAGASVASTPEELLRMLTQ